jgi:hypothetical protein
MDHPVLDTNHALGSEVLYPVATALESNEVKLSKRM